uniref:Uncharacterized protein n=1 Tax=Arion vulgaris TaxID=1028688 RepID=A0A0B6ZF48_9EUPU
MTTTRQLGSAIKFTNIHSDSFWMNSISHVRHRKSVGRKFWKLEAINAISGLNPIMLPMLCR